ncbi:MAG: hypothetical protein R3B90_07225 [Planctomycetaceae bacterium]
MAANLELRLKAPETVAVGSEVPVEIVLTVSPSAAARDVVLDCRFDEGFGFPGQTEHHVQQSLGTLSAGSVRSIPLTLTAESAGRHRIGITLSAGGRQLVEREAFVRCEGGDVEISVVGPDARYVGNRAEYVLTISNRSQRSIADAVVIVRHGGSLVAREVSAGVQRGADLLTWKLGSLLPEERVQIQAEFECFLVDPQASVQVEFRSTDNADSRSQRLAITSAPDPWRLSIADRQDPVEVGGAAVFNVELACQQPVAAGQATLRCDLPAGLEFVSARVADSELVPSQRTADRLDFANLPALGAVPLRLELTLRATAKERAGGVAVRGAGDIGDAAREVESLVVVPKSSVDGPAL